MDQKITPTVGVLVFQEDKVLLVRHEDVASNITGVYGVPGGRLNGIETEKEAAIRELREETGLETDTDNLQAYPENVYIADIERKDGTIGRFSDTIFVCTGFTGELVASAETTPMWVPITEVYAYKLLPNIAQMIQDGKEALEANDGQG